MNWSKHNIELGNKRGVQVMVFCPQCRETRKKKNVPSLSVNTQTGMFNCKNCGFKGCAANQETSMIQERKEYKRPEVRPQAVGGKLSAWFKARGISNETLLTAKVTECREYMPQVEAERNCACFNYYRDDELVNIKFRDGQKNFKLTSGAELIFYNLNAIQGRAEAIITEGEIDCLSLIEIGITNVLSVPNGAAKGNQKLVYLDNCIDYFADKTKITIATDSDEAGVLLKNELVRRLGTDRCYIVSYPKDCKDSNEVLLKHGGDVLRSCIGNATQPKIEGVFTVDDMRDGVDYIALKGYPHVESIDFVGFNDLLKWRQGEVTVVTGIPGHGKSEFIDQIMVKLSCMHKWRWGVFSPENQPTELHVIKLIEKLGGESLRKMSNEYRKECLDVLADYFFFLAIEEIDLTIDGILDKFAELVKRYGINGILIDPYNHIDHDFNGMSETLYISQFLTKIVLFARKYNVHVFLVAHPAKMKKDLSTKKYDVPTPYDIAGSGHFFNKAFNCISVYRHDDTQSVHVHVQKVKFKFVGRKGMQEFKYDTETGRYYEAGDKLTRDIRHVQEKLFDVPEEEIKKQEFKEELEEPF